jgi:hypothetical protein
MCSAALCSKNQYFYQKSVIITFFIDFNRKIFRSFYIVLNTIILRILYIFLHINLIFYVSLTNNLRKKITNILQNKRKIYVNIRIIYLKDE